MIAGDDLPVMETCRIKVPNVRGGIRLHRKFKHLIEIAVIQCAVPAD